MTKGMPKKLLISTLAVAFIGSLLVMSGMLSPVKDAFTKAVADGLNGATGSTEVPSVTVPKLPSNAPVVKIPPTDVKAAKANLSALSVKGRAAKSGYTREQFGQAWADVDRNGCDTRNDILNRDLTNKTWKPGTKSCVVLTGVLADPYTGKTINFQRGAASTAVQIDHRVALSNAWQTGAQSWSLDKRTAFANDPLNLIAVDGPTNGAKGDGDAATWLPPNKAYRCEYVSAQISVKAKYGLWVTNAERDAMVRVLDACGK